MNKALNTVLFMIAATLVNLILIALIFVALIMILSLFLDENSNTQLITVAYGLSILLAIGGGFYLYNRLIRWVSDKWHLENYIISSINRRRK